MGEGERLIEELERELKARLPQLSSIYIRPEKSGDATAQFVVEAGWGAGAGPPEGLS